MLIKEKKYTSREARVLLEVIDEEDGLRLDEVAGSYLTSLSRESVKKLIRSKNVELKNRVTKNAPHTRVREGDEVVILHREKRSSQTLSVLFEDESIIAVNKPKGLLTHPSGRHLCNTMSVLVEEYLGKKIFPVHRLDKETSGVLLFAKCSEVASLLRELFDKSLITKKYAFTSKNLEWKNPDRGLIDLSLSEDESSSISLKQKVSKDGKRSLTRYQIINKDEDRIHGLAWPLTGRLHQIRVHLSHLGAPIIGDHIYDGDDFLYWDSIHKKSGEQLQLECVSLLFNHPVNLKEVEISLDNFH